mmetsp:Transcript_15082/g.31541  ORF Transcript_15082/g.31541 Transcript_15082/m.31541 type:complete len:224 (+) Transcript_15082:1397-2068(+)
MEDFDGYHGPERQHDDDDEGRPENRLHGAKDAVHHEVQLAEDRELLDSPQQAHHAKDSQYRNGRHLGAAEDANHFAKEVHKDDHEVGTGREVHEELETVNKDAQADVNHVEGQENPVPVCQPPWRLFSTFTHLHVDSDVHHVEEDGSSQGHIHSGHVQEPAKLEAQLAPARWCMWGVDRHCLRALPHSRAALLLLVGRGGIFIFFARLHRFSPSVLLGLRTAA